MVAMVAQKDNEPMSGPLHEPMSGPMHEPMSGPMYELSYYRTPQGMDRRLDIRCRVHEAPKRKNLHYKFYTMALQAM